MRYHVTRRNEGHGDEGSIVPRVGANQYQSSCVQSPCRRGIAPSYSLRFPPLALRPGERRNNQSRRSCFVISSSRRIPEAQVPGSPLPADVTSKIGLKPGLSLCPRHKPLQVELIRSPYFSKVEAIAQRFAWDVLCKAS